MRSAESETTLSNKAYVPKGLDFRGMAAQNLITLMDPNEDISNGLRSASSSASFEVEHMPGSIARISGNKYKTL